MDLWLIFITGLTVGGFSCLAVQGGLLASTIAAREEEDLEEGRKKRHTLLPTASFLVTKLGAYIILGFILGFFGEKLQISDTVRTYMQLAAGLYMVVVALNLLNVHPIFRYAVIQPPRFLTKMVRNQSKSKDLFAPGLLGAMTIFIPCGTTLAMEALAISSGNGLKGALILGVFILGTSPLFLVIGYLTTALGDAFRAKFLKLAAVLVTYLGFSTVNGSLILAGSPITIKSMIEAIPIQVNFGEETGDESNVKNEDGVQVVDIKVYPNGYEPNYVRVKVGEPVKMDLTPTNGYGCTAIFVMPQLGVRKRLYQGSTETVEFTPKQPGKLTWTCSMGMYYGTLEVI